MPGFAPDSQPTQFAISMGDVDRDGLAGITYLQFETHFTPIPKALPTQPYAPQWEDLVNVAHTGTHPAGQQITAGESPCPWPHTGTRSRSTTAHFVTPWLLKGGMTTAPTVFDALDRTETGRDVGNVELWARAGCESSLLS